MKKLLILFLLANFSLAAQVKGVVTDEDGKPIPYVNIWVENENSGATADKDGKFSINAADNKTLVFSAVGFETKKIAAAAATEKLVLTHAITALDEIVMQQPTGKKQLIIDAFKKKDVAFGYGCVGLPMMVAKFFEYNDSLSATPFLKRITIMTTSYINNATFNLRLLEVNDDGSPGKI
ncbi:carboxypeptidase-like regulatory domain-containing protein [Flavobacterium sp. 3HN19-14]|uniref:carboxypeptidase-like regulatory domain-containing protein n=1 Tax=Flavobacterium sp. 3HN19-14 TaxID=3448133 RepID=UPI003EE170F2